MARTAKTVKRFIASVSKEGDVIYQCSLDLDVTPKLDIEFEQHLVRCVLMKRHPGSEVTFSLARSAA